MKKLLSLILALALALTAGLALADNATIAVHGRDGFNEAISNMFVVDGKLLMASYNNMYQWSPEEGLVKLEGYSDLEKALVPVGEEDDERILKLGEDEFELAEDEHASFYTALYTAEDKIYRIAIITGDEGAVGVLLVERGIDENGRFVVNGALDLGDDLIEDYGSMNLFGVNAPDQAVYMDGMLYGLSYGMSGSLMVIIDLEESEAEAFELDTDAEVSGMAAFDEDSVLLIGKESIGASERTVLLRYDVNRDEVTELGTLPLGKSGVTLAPCYDPERDMLYYVQDGSVWRVSVTEDGVGKPEVFGDMPLEIYTDANPVMLGDLYVLSSYSGVLGRDVTVAKMPAQRLSIQNSTDNVAVRSAYFDFTAQHPEFAVSISGGSDDKDALLQSMLSRSTDVDIYVMYAYDPAFSPLLTRGYMAELGDSEILNAFAEKLYPALSEAGMRRGELYAVPLDALGSAPSLNLTALEKLGYTEDDIPETWIELFELFSELPDKMTDFPELYLFGPDETESSAKTALFGDMMSSYLLWLEQDDAHISRGNEMLLSLINAFGEINWEDFDLPEEIDESQMFFFTYEPQNTIYSKQTVNPLTYTMGEIGDFEAVTLKLALAEGETPLIPAEVPYMFVNPFSTHRQEAIEYIESVVSHLSDDVRIQLMPDENEPIPSADFDDVMKMYDGMLADAQAGLARAERNEDDEMIARYTSDLSSVQEAQAWYERTGRWNVSAEAIEVLREDMVYVVPSRSNLWSSATLSSQTRQYLAGSISARQYVSDLEKTLQMQRLEDM